MTLSHQTMSRQWLHRSLVTVWSYGRPQDAVKAPVKIVLDDVLRQVPGARSQLTGVP